MMHKYAHLTVRICIYARFMHNMIAVICVVCLFLFTLQEPLLAGPHFLKCCLSLILRSRLEFSFGLGQVRVRVRHLLVMVRIKIRAWGMHYVRNSQHRITNMCL